MKKNGLVIGCALAVWFGAFLLQCIFVRYGVGTYDEGLMLSDAAAMLAGRWPVSDFWSTYPPGAYAWIAVVFHVFGSQILFARLVSIAIVATLPGICVMLLAPALGLGRAVIAAAILAVWVAGTATLFDYPPPIAAAAGALAILLLQGEFGIGRIIAAGLVCGFTALIRLDLGFAAMLAGATIFWTRRNPAHGGRLPAIIVLALTSAIPVVTGLSLYFYHGGVQALRLLYQRLIVYNAVDFPGARQIAFPVPLPFAAHVLAWELEIILVYVMIAMLAAVLLLSLFQRHKGVLTDGVAAGLAVLALFGAVLFHSRADPPHAWVLIAVGTIACLRAFGRNILVLPFLALVLAGGLAAAQARWDTDIAAPHQAFDEPHAAGILIPDWFAGYRQVIAAARSANMIYSGGDQHRHVFVNDVMIYYMSDHLPPTEFVETVPAVVDTAPVQRKIVEDLRSAKPSLVIGIPQPMLEPNLSSRDGHVTILDDEINRYCRQSEVIADYTLRQCDWTSSNKEQGN